MGPLASTKIFQGFYRAKFEIFSSGSNEGSENRNKAADRFQCFNAFKLVRLSRYNVVKYSQIPGGKRHLCSSRRPRMHGSFNIYGTRLDTLSELSGYIRVKYTNKPTCMHMYPYLVQSYHHTMSYFTLPYTLSELTLPSRALINGESSGPRDRKHSDTVQCLSYLKVERRRCFSIGFESVASGALKREGGYLSRRQMKE